MTAGVVDEGDLPTQTNPEAAKVGIARLLFAFTGLYERWKNEYENRRHPSDRGPVDYDPDEFRVPIHPREPYIRIERYDEGGGGKQSWRDWILGIVGSLVVMGIGAVIYQLADIKADV